MPACPPTASMAPEPGRALSKAVEKEVAPAGKQTERLLDFLTGPAHARGLRASSERPARLRNSPFLLWVSFPGQPSRCPATRVPGRGPPLPTASLPSPVVKFIRAGWAAQGRRDASGAQDLSFLEAGPEASLERRSWWGGHCGPMAGFSAVSGGTWGGQSPEGEPDSPGRPLLTHQGTWLSAGLCQPTFLEPGKKLLRLLVCQVSVCERGGLGNHRGAVGSGTGAHWLLTALPSMAF